MRTELKWALAYGAALVIGIAVPQEARADVAGFGDFSQFTINQNDSGSPPTVPAPGTIELTNAGDEVRSIFNDAPQNIVQFTASFTFQATNVSGFNGGLPGATFVLENDSHGASAVGNSVDNYGFQGVANSAGVALDIVSNTTGFFADGTVGVGQTSVSPVNLASGDPINVQLTYSGSTLTESLFDTVTDASFSTTDLLSASIPATVGDDTAFVGLTAGSSSRALAGADEYFSNFEFTSGVPEPASLGLLGIGAVVGLTRRRRR